MNNEIVRIRETINRKLPILSNAMTKMSHLGSKAMETIFSPEAGSDYTDRNTTCFPENSSYGEMQVRTSSNNASGRVCYVLDISISMSEMCDPQTTKIQAAKDACVTAMNVLARSSHGDKVAIVVFNLRAKVICSFVNVVEGYTQLFDSVQKMQASGGTNISRGLQAAFNLMNQSPATHNDRVVLLSDGHGGDGTSVADHLKSRGVAISTVGFGQRPLEVDEGILKRIASNENGIPLYEFANNKFDLTKTMIKATQLAAQ